MNRKMKDSKIEWIGEIPEDWRIARLKDYFMFEKSSRAALYTKEYIGSNKGEFPLYSGQTENFGIMGFINSYDYDIDECLFTTTVGAKVMSPKILRGKFSLSQNCLIMNQIKYCDNRFVYYILNPLFDFEKSLIPTYMQPSLRMSDLNRYQFFLPLSNEQKSIANFLDQKVAEIDHIIDKTKLSIEEYKKYKQSLITETVTKGLNPDVKMKDSGIEWIGEIPEHWNIAKTRNVTDFITDGAHVSPETENGKYDFISTVDLKGEYIDFSNCLKTSESSYFQLVKNGCKPMIGDVLISKDGTVGKTVVIDFEMDFVVASSLVIMRPLKSINSYFLNFVLQSKIVQEQLNSFMKGSGLKRVSVKNNGNILIAIASKEEQNQIIDFLNKKCNKIDVLIIQKQKLLSELESYKKSLIFECVTGKRQVI